jgi:ABC-type branched-subunit amino acid transport system substrate-binding protein
VQIRKRWVERLGVVAAAGGLLAAVVFTGTSASAAGKSTTATKSPIVFAMIDLTTGPVVFPQAEQGAQAAVDYVNKYEDGINGHVIKLKLCGTSVVTDPAAAATCANQLVADNPLLVIGGADVGASASLPIWKAHNLAYVGGDSFTPVESNASDAEIFNSLNVADNASALGYAKNKLGVKSVAIIEANDAQGLATGGQLAAYAKGLGLTYTLIPQSDTATPSQFSAVAAQAASSNPGLIYVELPFECAPQVVAIRAGGYTGEVSGLDTCGEPQDVSAEGSSGNGLFFTTPIVNFDQIKTKLWGSEIKITKSALAQFAPSIAWDANAGNAFGTIMNLHATLDSIKGALTTSKILAALRKPGEHPNWLAHPYDCATHLVPTQSSVCQPWEIADKIENGKVLTLTTKWLNGGDVVPAADYSTPAS